MGLPEEIYALDKKLQGIIAELRRQNGLMCEETRILREKLEIAHADAHDALGMVERLTKGIQRYFFAENAIMNEMVTITGQEAELMNIMLARSKTNHGGSDGVRDAGAAGDPTEDPAAERPLLADPRPGPAAAGRGRPEEGVGD